MKKTLFLLLLVFLASQVYANSITIESVTSSPSETQPGERVYINVRLENQGTKDIKDVAIGLDLTSADLPFIPVGSAAKKTIEEIENDESESVEFIFMVSSNAKPDTYKIPIVVSYKDDNEILEEKSVIGLVVKAPPFLEVAIEESEVFKVGQVGEVTVRFVNKGLGDIKFLSAKIEKSTNYDIVSSNTVYVGNIGPDDFETASFKMGFRNRFVSIPLEVDYKDNNNKEYKQTFSLELPLYSQKEAIELGLESKSRTGVYIGIVVIVVLFFLIRRYRKRKMMRG
ncbi:hypothetical protein J4443_03195 [Candidatus Woesearchaeota archaeon]|nr:hypothetical protein [Candidatus Woesearchaeota archaeon]